jgi:cell wall-associated NlpC family hydrolase
MVGRLSTASLIFLAVAALAAPLPAIAEPERRFSDPLEPSANLPLSEPAGPADAEILDPTESVTPLAASRPAIAEPVRVLDPTEAAAGRPAATAASPEAQVPAASRDQALDSGELGVEYQLSVHDADSFLDHLSARWKRLVEQAMTYLGTPYRRGGTSRRGLDCSGLVGAVYGEQGLELPRTAAEQFREGVEVAEGDLRPGDLVFFRDTYKRGISHVGIYIGDGRFLHAAGRRHGVIVSELSRSYYHLRFAGGRRPAAEPAAADRQASQPVSAAAPAAAAESTLASAPR